MTKVIHQEELRLQLQKILDATKSQAERNKLGQFSTPPELAHDILAYAKTLLSAEQPVRFLDPAFGLGAFYSALRAEFPSPRIAQATGVEIDPMYGSAAIKLWSHTPLVLHIADFTHLNSPTDRANLLICNPPYVRHHHLTTAQKAALQVRSREATGITLNGLAGLYCHFVLIAHAWMEEGGLAGWLIPSEFMDVNYGKALKEYLLTRVTLERVHLFDPSASLFDDALTSSSVIWFRKILPSPETSVTFSYGGSLLNPVHTKTLRLSRLSKTEKWTVAIKEETPLSPKPSATLADFFVIKRGIATGANSFFIMTPPKVAHYHIPAECLVPILPSPRCLKEDEIKADALGDPLLENRLYLFTCSLEETEIQARYPAVWQYLETGIKAKINEGYLCAHRKPWYAQEKRPSAPLLCTYMGRRTEKPFRFILNHSAATAPNVYLMLYPRPPLNEMLKINPALLEALWRTLNQISPDNLRNSGRIYGGGLYKIEPNELGSVSAGSLLDLIPEMQVPANQLPLL